MTGAMERLGYLFYAVSPRRTMFKREEDVPNYVTEAMPWFVVLVLLEMVIIAYREKKSSIRINDSFGSISQGMLQQIAKLIVKGAEVLGYVWVYKNYRLATLPWNSYWTWGAALVGADLGYYLLHRASHEINLLWAAHQVHHSSEEYNLTTALRQSVLQPFSTWMFYLPFAFIGIPPPIFLVHVQLNTLYQFWVHTKLIGKLGPIEHIFVTPSHHRVHHGRNRYCIDKNYGGMLIVWDKLFGTFEDEKEEVVYGVTHPINTFNSFTIQLCHYQYIWDTFWATPGIANKISVLLKGPGWSPGKPRCGDIEDIPDVHAPVEVYDPKLPSWCNVYLWCASMTLNLFFVVAMNSIRHFTPGSAFLILSFVVLTIYSLGEIMDKSPRGVTLEITRCLLYFVLERMVLASNPHLFTGANLYLLHTLKVIFTAFLLFWLALLVNNVKIKSKLS